MAVHIDIRLKRANKVYREEENVDGIIRLESPSEFKYDAILLTMEGVVNLQLSPKNVGLFDAFYNSVNPVQLVFCVVEISSSGKMPAGLTEIPFEIPLVPRLNKTLYETYHGVFVNIQYNLKCELRRSFLSKDIIKTVEFVVENKKDSIDPNLRKKMNDSSVKFTIAPNSLQSSHNADFAIPNFSVEGTMFATICDISQPFTGEVIVHKSDAIIKSIELQLVRVETCGCAEGFAREATEIQNIQIGDGNVPCDIKLPIYMIFPRLFSCPTLKTTNFKIEFEINFVIIFEGKHLVTENFPIILIRK